MPKAYFGTDGIRGAYGGPVINPDFHRRLGLALARFAAARGGAGPGGTGAPTIVIGRDTRASGPELEAALVEGLAAAGCGVQVVPLGVVPTPAVALAVSHLGAALGVVLTASHNPAGDNGIKLFSGSGAKLADKDEVEIEERLASAGACRVGPGAPAVAPGFDGAAFYLDTRRRELADGALEGWRVVVDAAHGATAGTTPRVLRELGAEVVALGDSPDGSNINAGVGSQHPAALAGAVRASGAQLGVAHDGDGDRSVFVDETGTVLAGDTVLAILGLDLLRRGELAGSTLVATVMSNLGLDRALEGAGGRVERVAVGDRHVVQRLLGAGFSFGGEPSGHFVFNDDSAVVTTGDGLLAALRLIGVMHRTRRPLSELARCLSLFPQVEANLAVAERVPLEESPGFRGGIARIEEALQKGGGGRVLVRYSGTEPLLRLLVEASSPPAAAAAMEELTTLARGALGER